MADARDTGLLPGVAGVLCYTYTYTVAQITIYLPDSLAAAIRGRELPVSQICQAALKSAIKAENRRVRHLAAVDTTPNHQEQT